MTGELEVTLTVRVGKSLAAKMRKAAEAQKRTLSNWLRLIIEREVGE
jgi:predicted HicB family RNase H-like nuclease